MTNTTSLILVQTAFDFVLIIVLLRLLLQLFHINFYNPITQFVAKWTSPVIQRLNRYLPTVKGVDSAVIALAFLISLLKFFALVYLNWKQLPHVSGTLLWAVSDLFRMTLNIFFYSVIVEIIFSWINPLSLNPVREIVHRFAAPLLGTARRIIPPIGGLDFSPIPVLILLKVAEAMVINPLQSFALQLSLV